MAIKISNVSVIDNSRNFVNANTIVFSGNSYFSLPAGGTDTRPVSPSDGMIRYNTDDGAFEGYSGGEWGPLGAGVNIVRTPTNTYPTNNAITPNNPTLEATSIQHVYDLEKAYGVWQISTTSSFATTVYNANVAGSANSHLATANLAYSNTFYWRVKYGAVDGNESNFSTPTDFTVLPAPPTVIGTSYAGGYYMGIVCNVDCSACYYLIVSPLATGQTACQWQTSQEFFDDCYTIDGYINTYCCKACGRYPAANWTATRTINGYSDWYLPATTEQFNYIIGGDPCLPVADRFTPPVACWWSSNQSRDPSDNPVRNAYNYRRSQNNFDSTPKINTHCVRAFRRTPV